MNTSIDIHKYVGEFAEDKDKAREIRNKQIIPVLEAGKTVILDFKDVDLSTQSFIHALISDVIRNYGIEVLDTMLFRNCNESLKLLINIVVEYMQWGIPSNTSENDNET